MQRYYDIVAEELKRRELRDGLWARALAETGADDSKARARYIKLRAEELHREDEEWHRAERARVEREAERARLEELRQLQEHEEREVAARNTEGPSLGRVFLLIVVAFVILAAVWALWTAFRR